MSTSATNLSPLHQAAGYGDIKTLNYLIGSGADVNALDNEGQVPLHNACCHGHFLAATKLIDAGALVDLPDHRGWTPLAFAIARNLKSERILPRYWKLIDLLLNNGASPYSKSVSGKTCLSRIKSKEDRRTVRITYLLNILKKIHQDDIKSDTINRYLKLDDYFELVKTGDENLDILKSITTTRLLNSRLASFDGITPLHRAAGYNHIETAKLFLSQGADPNAMDNFGRIPLHNAAQFGHVDMIDLLVQCKSDVNKQDFKGYSPLHVAASNPTYFASFQLIELGANVNLRCKANKLPYDLAETDDVREILKPEILRHEIKLIPSTSEQQAVYVHIEEKDSSADTNPVEFTQFPRELMLDSSSNNRLFNNSAYKIKRITLQEGDHRYDLVKKKMMDSIRVHNSDSGGQFTSYNILGIDFILNEKVWSLYKLACLRLEEKYGLGSKNEMLLFHGSKHIDNIEKKGFDESYAKRNGMFGAGIYFAEHSSKSNQYTFGLGEGCDQHQDKSCYVCERKLVYAQVALGRILISREAMPDCAHAPPGYSSVAGAPGFTDNLNYPELVIYRGDQAYPLFVIRYKISPL